MRVYPALFTCAAIGLLGWRHWWQKGTGLNEHICYDIKDFWAKWIPAQSLKPALPHHHPSSNVLKEVFDPEGRGEGGGKTWSYQNNLPQRNVALMTQNVFNKCDSGWGLSSLFFFCHRACLELEKSLWWDKN